MTPSAPFASPDGPRISRPLCPSRNSEPDTAATSARDPGSDPIRTTPARANGHADRIAPPKAATEGETPGATSLPTKPRVHQPDGKSDSKPRTPRPKAPKGIDFGI